MKKILFIATIFIFCIGMCFFTAKEPDIDLWARLIAGQYIVDNLSVLKYDFLSYTPTHPWYDHEWGASVFFYLALKYFGVNGLIFLKGILSALTVFFCYKTVEVRNNNEPKKALNILYYAFMFWIISNCMGAIVRCLMFTCLFFAIFLYILERYRYKGGKCLIWLPFLMIFWSNIHGGCISAFGLLGIYIAGEFLNKRPVKPYIYTLLACLAALFINPYGFDYVKFLFFAASMDRANITEWFSPFSPRYIEQYSRYKFYLIFILLVQWFYFVINKTDYKKLDKTKFLLLLAMTYLSVTHIRHITFFVYTAGTIMYDEFYSILNSVSEKINFKNEDLKKSLVLLKDIIIYSFLILLTFPSSLELNKGISITESAYPRFAVEFIKINNIKGNLFVNFDWGSYAAYKLYPNNLIVMDGRYEEVYDPDLLNEMNNFHMVKDDWYKIIREYKTDVMIIEKKYPVYNVMLKHPDWVNVFENNFSGVFVPANNVQEHYLYPIPDNDYYNRTMFETNIKKGII